MSRRRPKGTIQWLHQYRAAVIGLIIAISGGTVVWISTLAETPPAQTFWSNVGTALITTGTVSVIYESLLQRSLIEQFRRAAGQAEASLAAGLEEVLVRSSDIELIRILGGRRSIRIIPEDPYTWQARNFSALKEAAASGCEIEIHLPSPKAYAHALNERGRVAELAQAERECSEIPKMIIRAWSKATQGVDKPSPIRILQYPGTVSIGLTMADDYVIVSTGGADGPEGGAEPITVVFRPPNDSPVRRWAEDSLSQLGSVVIDGSQIPIEPEPPRTPEEILPLAEEISTVGQSDRLEVPGR